MNTTQQLLEEVKRTTGAQTDYALGKRLGWGHSKVSNYRCGRSQMDVDACFVVAELLGKDPAAVIAAVEAERATKPEAREAWIQRLKQLGGVAASVVFVMSGALPAPADAAGAQHGYDASVLPYSVIFRTWRFTASRCLPAWFSRFRRVLQSAFQGGFAAHALT